MVSVCLNMIVKNEGAIIRRLFESVVDYIDTFVICDTGSSDNTILEIEEFFKEKRITGRILSEPFRHFEYNRNHALQACDGILTDTDYILFMDADMVFSCSLSPVEFKSTLISHDVHYLFQICDTLQYKNIRLIRNMPGIHYWGVTHEVLHVPDTCTFHVFSQTDCFIQDIGDGGCKTDKYQRDVSLLKSGLIEFPDEPRYTFYLANSYYSLSQLDDAIACYLKRIALGGWVQEVWYSCFMVGNAYREKGDMVNAVHYWMEAYSILPERIESLYHIVNYYRIQRKYTLAHMFYAMAKKRLDVNRCPNHLFLRKDVYEYKLEYEMTIIGYYCNPDNVDLAELSKTIMNCPTAEEAYVKDVAETYAKYYA